jgi:hypothetical protein
LFIFACLGIALVGADNGKEYPPSDEPQRIGRITSLFSSLMSNAASKGEPWLRNAHAKGHACVRARLNVSSSLTSALAQGVFVPGASYPAFIRYSNGVGRGFSGLNANKSDIVPDNRGLALKLFLKDGSTQDFLMTTDRNGFLPDAATAEGFFTAVSKGTFALGTFLALHPSVAANFALLGLHGATLNLLKATFWQQVPSRYGARAAKFMLQPCDQNSRLPDGPNTFKNFLADNLKANLASSAKACYTFLVQFFDADNTTPIEDATVQWNTQWWPVATLEIEAYASQSSFGDNQQAFCESMSFNPWHTKPEHQPLGCLNRIRKPVYTGDATHRHNLNHQKDKEVTIADWNAFPNL